MNRIRLFINACPGLMARSEAPTMATLLGMKKNSRAVILFCLSRFFGIDQITKGDEVSDRISMLPFILINLF